MRDFFSRLNLILFETIILENYLELKCLFSPKRVAIHTINMAIEREINEKLTMPSTNGGPSWPLAITPSIFPPLKMAAIRIPRQLAKVP